MTTIDSSLIFIFFFIRLPLCVCVFIFMILLYNASLISLHSISFATDVTSFEFCWGFFYLFLLQIFFFIQFNDFHFSTLHKYFVCHYFVANLFRGVVQQTNTFVFCLFHFLFGFFFEGMPRINAHSPVIIWRVYSKWSQNNSQERKKINKYYTNKWSRWSRKNKCLLRCES